jgi:hypothetical protein
MASIITSLKHCQFDIENLYKLILIMKNWLENPRFGCTNVKPKSIEEYIDIENGMVSKNEELISDFNLFEEN